MNWLHELTAVFRPPSAEVLAVRQYEDAKRRLLDALANQEYSNSLVDLYSNQVKRLAKTTKENANAS